MKIWWLGPLIRVISALALPLLVPAIITTVIWSLPGDPASIICPPEICSGTEVLAKNWNLDQGPVHFFTTWVGNFLQGDMGDSWRYLQGVPVTELIVEAIPNTLILLFASIIPLTIASILGLTQWISKKFDGFLVAFGVLPCLVLGLVFAAIIKIQLGAAAFDDEAYWYRIIAGALTLGLTDGVLSGAIIGFRDIMSNEEKERYAQISILRGETPFGNAFINVVNTLSGQYRGRILQLLSSLVIVEVLLEIDGVGMLLWGGTLFQDFGLVLGATTIFALISSSLLLLQALIEVVVAIQIRKAPTLSLEESSQELL